MTAMPPGKDQEFITHLVEKMRVGNQRDCKTATFRRACGLAKLFLLHPASPCGMNAT
ncbi:hypothetical protein [uncultured Roseobacter sp.]|uniref:hypothetical protein n=1 Tax=uncultured Roseobacter sp. TaxID=114847 RepID=UPI00263197BF|nr:hypothetical protein [uncultured Roseobacter sp.]